MKLHKLLNRQIRKTIPNKESFIKEYSEFLELLNEHYQNNDIDYKFTQRSMDLSSQEFLDANAELNAIFKVIPDLFFRISSDGTILTFKGGAEANLIMKRKNYYKKKIYNISNQVIKDKFIEAINYVKEHHSLHSFDYLLNINSENKYYEARLIPLIKDEILIVIRDITVQKVTIFDLVASKVEILNEKEKLSITLNSIEDAVITTDENSNILFANKAAEQLVQCSLDTIYKKKVKEILEVRDRNSGTKIDYSMHGIENFIRNKLYLNSLLFIDKTGNEKIVLNKVSYLFNSSNNLTGLVFVFIDLTEKEYIQDELNKNQKLDSLGVLAGGIAHDFNNLLTGILGNISLSKMYNTKDLQKFNDRIVAAEKACKRAKQLTEQLLTFSKGGSPNKKITSIIPLIKESISFALHKSNFQIEFQHRFADYYANIDEGQISQVFNNLIINAIQSMSDGGKIYIDIRNININEEKSSGLAYGDYIVINIKDAGSGISEKNLKKIFDPFFTTKKKGNGLGLASCYSIIKKHNGTIKVQSKLGEGSVFSIYLPQCKESSESINTISDGPEAETKYNRILIMEDEDSISNVLSEILLNMGYKVDIAVDGLTALKMYINNYKTDEEYDLIIMDLTIKDGLGGAETAKKIFAVKNDVKIIVSSGYSNDPITSKYKDYCYKAYLEKPYGVEQVRRVLAEAINKL